MSYDLTFVARSAGQSWEQAIDATQELDAGTPPDPRTWDLILAAARHVLGDVSVVAGEDCCWLGHERSSIQLTYSPGLVEITVPYHYQAAMAKTIVDALYRLGQLVEAATGLSGYDPQLDLPLAEATAKADIAAQSLSRITTFLSGPHKASLA